MKATIITIGDEILIGQIVDTNSVSIAKHLNAAGIDYRLLVENRYTRARIFTGGRQNSDSAYQYTIFVHKDDLDRARDCLSQDYRSIP